MTTAWTNTQIQTTYGDGLQLGSSGAGLSGTLARVRDGLGNATPLLLSTTTLQIDGNVGLLFGNNVGGFGVGGGIRFYQADGVTAVSIVTVDTSNNLHFDPSATAGLVFFGKSGTTSGPNVVVCNTRWYQSEGPGGSQDLNMMSVDSSGNLLFGNDNVAGSNLLNDTYMRVQTGKAFHWIINTTEVMKIDANGNNILGLTAPVNTATSGFPCIPLMGAAPTGAFTPPTGFAGMVVDSANNKVWFRYGGNWKFALLS